MAVSGRLQEQSADIAQRLAELADAIERKAKEERERTSSK